MIDLLPVDPSYPMMDSPLQDNGIPQSFEYDNRSSFYINDAPWFQPQVDDESWGSHDNSLYSSTAVNKQLNFPPCDEVSSDWRSKSFELWTPSDTLNWIAKVAQDKEFICEEIHNFSDIDGYRLTNMTEEKFCILEPNCGKKLFEALQNLKLEQGLVPVYEVLGRNLPTTVPELKPLSTLTCNKREPIIENEQPKKRPPGRPRIPGRRNKKQEKKTGRLWEFIRDLLLKPEYCPSLICWEDYEQGVFRFVHSEKVARLWGTIKENPKMTYEKLSRAMRYYYKSKVLQPVIGRRLVYKFGPTATGWHTANPNFKIKDSVKCKL